jgi:hypothetical protein
VIIDLHKLSIYSSEFNMSCETLKELRHLSRPGDFLVSPDLADGYYGLGSREEDRDIFTIIYRGELWRLACLPMGWSRSAYYLCKLTQAFTKCIRRATKSPIVGMATSHSAMRRILRNTIWRKARVGPYMDDFTFMADSRAATLLLRDRVETSLHRLGLQRNPKKGLWEPTQVGSISAL